MTLNQLFKKRPTIELVLEILKLLKINNMEEIKYKSFSKNDITRAVLDEMENMRHIFEEYYIKCKFDIYFTFIDQKKVVTILRQCLKAIDYKASSIDINRDYSTQIQSFEPFFREETNPNITGGPSEVINAFNQTSIGFIDNRELFGESTKRKTAFE